MSAAPQVQPLRHGLFPFGRRHRGLLGRGLRAVKSDPKNLDARLDCQLGSWMSIVRHGALLLFLAGLPFYWYFTRGKAVGR